MGRMQNKNNTAGKFCFLRYCDETSLKSNSASAAINHWLKAVVGSHAVLYGLRHGVRDKRGSCSKSSARHVVSGVIRAIKTIIISL